MTALIDMPMQEAVLKAFETMLYADYLDEVANKHSWREAFEGSFEEWLDNSGYVEDFEPWHEFKTSGKSGEKDGWIAKVEAEYGGEGRGEAYWMVISVSDGVTTRYFRKDGYYASYDGGYLDGDTYEVTPRSRQVVFYETEYETTRRDSSTEVINESLV